MAGCQLRGLERRPGRRVAAIALLALSCVLNVACTGDRPEQTAPSDPEAGGGAGTSASDGPAQPKEAVGRLTLPAAATFAQHCAKCHGPDGAYYARPFRYQGEALREMIRKMMTDNAGLQPTEADVDAMLAFHLQIRQGDAAGPSQGTPDQ